MRGACPASLPGKPRHPVQHHYGRFGRSFGAGVDEEPFSVSRHVPMESARPGRIPLNYLGVEQTLWSSRSASRHIDGHHISIRSEVEQFVATPSRLISAALGDLLRVFAWGRWEGLNVYLGRSRSIRYIGYP